jgi:ribose transport system substrate-binding protein
MSKRFWLTISIVIVALAAVCVTSFAQTADNTPVNTAKYKKAPPWTIGFSNASVSNSWRVTYDEHIKFAIDEARAKGLIKNFYETNANDDATKQIADIEDLLTKGIDLLIVSPSTEEALTPEVEKVMKKGIPVVMSDRTITSKNYVTFVSVSSEKMAEVQAEWLTKQLGGKGNIVLFTGLAGSSPAEIRLASAKAVFAKNPGIKVLDKPQYTGWSPVQAKQMMETLIQKYPKIDGVWVDGMEATGCVEAFLDAGLPVPPITSEDFNKFLKIWKANKLNAMASNNDVRQGYDAVQQAFKVLRGETVTKVYLRPNGVYTNENLDKYVRTDLPDDFWTSSMPEVVKRLFPN